VGVRRLSLMHMGVGIVQQRKIGFKIYSEFHEEHSGCFRFMEIRRGSSDFLMRFALVTVIYIRKKARQIVKST
jgi:hypothetical protein